MNIFVHQNITIHNLKIEGLSNSSVLQIGSAGLIKPLSNLFNTGGFTRPAPPIQAPPAQLPTEPLVPLARPSR